VKKSWLLFFVIPGLWGIALIAPLILFLKTSDPIFISVLLIICGGIAGALMSALFILWSPFLKSLKMRAKELQAFCEAIRKAASKIEVQELLDISSEIVVQVTGVKGCTISIRDPKSGELKVRAKTGIEYEEQEIAEDISHTELLEGKPFRVKDLRRRDFPEVDDEIESLLCVPLRIEEKILGAVCIYGERGQKLSSELNAILSSLSNVIALALAHAFVYEDLKHLVNTKTQFMFQTSHELRSPLNAIQSMTKLLTNGYMGGLSEKQRELVMRIDTRANKLSETVNDLLKLAKGRAQVSTIKLTKVNLSAIVQESIDFFTPRAQEAKVTIEIRSLARDAVVTGTEDLLRSIVTNLLSNGIKYTPPGGKVAIGLVETSESARLAISDTGIGIPKEDQDLLFQEFFRASNALKIAKVGTGLGLSIVKSHVDMCGGTIGVESEEHKGTTFTVVFKK
jgi:signal transduction histidine kinase